MSRYIILFCAALLVLLPSNVWARDSLWKTASALATCQAYDRLQGYLERFEYTCKSVAPPFHRDLIEEDWIQAAKLSVCYIGSVNHILPIPSAYQCSVFSDRSDYHELVCTREYPENQIAYDQSILSDWQTSLVTDAAALKSCVGRGVEFSFTGGSVVPHMLLDRYQHELGVALSKGHSLMYLGAGFPKSCGSTGNKPILPMGVLSFFVNPQKTEKANPIFWENNIEVGNGLQLTFTGMKDLATIRKQLDPGNSWGTMPQGVAIAMRSVGLSVEADMRNDNFGTILAFRDIDFLSIFDSALLDVELDLNFYEIYDVEERVEAEMDRNLVWQAMACRFPGAGGFDKARKMFRKVRIFEGDGATGCRNGHVYLMYLPLAMGEGLSVETLFVLVGSDCNDLSRTTGAIARMFSKAAVEDILFELGEERNR